MNFLDLAFYISNEENIPLIMQVSHVFFMNDYMLTVLHTDSTLYVGHMEQVDKHLSNVAWFSWLKIQHRKKILQRVVFFKNMMRSVTTI